MKVYEKLILRFLIVILIFFPSMALAAERTKTAVVITASAGWGSGAHSIISGEPVNGNRTVQNKILPTISDLVVCTHGRYFYRIERFLSDNISKFDIARPGEVIWNVPALVPGEPGLQSNSSNPYTMVFASNEKAYLIRYGAKTAWVVNPSVSYEDRDNFKIGELDLSAYAVAGGSANYNDTDGYPEMCGGLVVNGKLFIVMQRLVDWCPKESVHSYVAVFDVATDTEIDTGKGEGNLKGIALPSPMYDAGFPEASSINYLKENNTIYISACASMGFCTSGVGGKGGVAAINPDTYETRVVLDAGKSNWEFGSIFSTAIASPTKGYFVSVPDAYGDGSENMFKSFNPATGHVIGDVSADLNAKDLWSITIDRDNKLWVCNSTDSNIFILNTGNDSVDEIVNIDPLPKGVAFLYTFNFETGDVNQQDGITGQDAVDGYNMTFKDSWTDEELWGADFNGDGEVTAQDAVDIFWASF